ncbi:hypothetical protein RS694_13455 [Rhodoferax saidenbachensis]|uniref:Bulb-type lectin domain-containing protein n=1 Tax=Rhodoferax saidenbachensis TaxID=1484693 RepID=A0A1P8KBN1_9BURK|nr:hypothetical protein RS694_13455 [Rhodoferax saidenbachensis]
MAALTLPIGIAHAQSVGWDPQTPIATRVALQDQRLMVLDPSFYLNKYPDLLKAFGPNNLEAAKQHWLNYGIKEGRQSSFAFSLPAYQAKNPGILWDRNIRTYEAVLDYYVKQGYKENLDTTPLDTPFDMPIGFDPDFYRQYYPDLTKAFGNNFGALTRHWRENGSREGRLPSRKALSEALALGVDPEFYANRYSDLRNAFRLNALALVQHYQNIGKSEGRFAMPGVENAFEAGPPSSGHGRQYLRKGDWLSTDQYLRSASRAYIAVQQGDGNFCVYKVGSPQDPTYPGLNWCSRNVSAPAGQYFTIFQGDGNLCTYAGTGPADNKGGIVCPSGPRNGEFFLILQDDGNLVMYPGKNMASRTGGANWNVGYYKNPKQSPGQWITNAANTVANGTVMAANTVANAAVIAANATANGVTTAANQTAAGTTQLANTIASGTVMAANTVASTTVAVANQVADFTTNMIDMMRGNCSAYSKYFPDPLAGMQQLTLLAQAINASHSNQVTGEVMACASEFKAGYYCQIPEELVSLVKDVKSIPDVVARSAQQSITKECAASFALTAPPLFMVQAPLACGAVKSMVEDSIKLTQCLIAAEKAGALGELISQTGGGSGTSTAQVCETAGKITLKIAKSVLSKNISANNPGAQVLGYFSKIRGASAISATTYKKLAELPACQ